MPSSDRVAIVTGGANGIGAACARRFVEEGLSVVIADTDEEAGEALARDLDGGKERAIFVDCDVSDKLAVANLMAETRAAFDRVDVLINNAAMVATGDVLSLDLDAFDKVMSVNLRGAFLVARACAKQMVEQIEAEGAR
ncbi:MAG: SDR family NAD(P)-dependent oxidoreductase, partial [Oceanicaulis sp.]